MSLLINNVPKVRGQLVSNADISSSAWFKVGGPFELLFIPADITIDKLFSIKASINQNDIKVSRMPEGVRKDLELETDRR